MKLTLEEKLKYVKMHVEDDVPIYDIEQEYGYNASRLKYHAALYKRWGEKAFEKDKQRKDYSRSMKLNAIKEVISQGKSCRQVALDLMLTDPAVVEDWVNKYKKEGEDGIKDTHSREAYKMHDDRVLVKEHKKLLEDLERTKAENEYLKKSFPLALERSKRFKKRQKSFKS